MKLLILYVSTSLLLVLSVRLSCVAADGDGSKSRSDVKFEIQNNGPLRLKPISVLDPQNPQQVVRAAFGAAIETILASLLNLLDLVLNKLKGKVFQKVSPGLDWIVGLL